MTDYTKWILSLPCGRCVRQESPTENHHLKSDLHQSGTSMKANDFVQLPLCATCHLAFHMANWGADWREEQRGILILTLIQALKEGVLAMGEIPNDDFH